MTNQELATTIIAALDLDPAPIAIAFANQPPAGVSIIQSEVPSSCSFWRRAEQGVFYAPAEAHFKCPVGAMVMGFELPQPVAEELGQLVGSSATAGTSRKTSPYIFPWYSLNQRELSTVRSMRSRSVPTLLSAG